MTGAGSNRGAGRIARLARFVRDRLPGRRTEPLARDLRAGIASGAVFPYYQPIVDLRSGAVVAFECLARWQHPERGMIAPDDFIPLAIRHGLIDDISRVLLRAATAEMRSWPGHIGLSLNIAPDQLLGPFAGGECSAILREGGISPARLVLEVTEESPIVELAAARATAQRLRSACIRLALDDFGKGHGNLGRLGALRFDRLKIDRQLIQAIGEQGGADVTAAVIGLAHAMGHSVIAEGVETAAQADTLRELGCGFAQGFHFGAPMPGDAASAIARRHAIAARIAAAREDDHVVFQLRPRLGDHHIR